jgi:hypothetical protein
MRSIRAIGGRENCTAGDDCRAIGQRLSEEMCEDATFNPTLRPNMSLIYLTEHGALRARQRCGWPETALHRMLDRIVAFGASPAKCPPAMAQWLDDLSGLHPRREFRVYGNHVFVFQPEANTGWHLITVLHLPRELLRSWHRQLHRWLAGAE